MVLWGIERSLDEHLWLGEDGRLGSDLVQLAGVLLVVGGAVILRAHQAALEGVAPHAPRAGQPGRDLERRGPTGLMPRRVAAGYSSRWCENPGRALPRAVALALDGAVRRRP